jgi:hypothetical protein
MADGCGWSLFAFGKSADRNAALTALPIMANEDLVTGSGNSGVGTQLYVREDGNIFAIASVAETAVSLQLRVKTTNQPDYIRSSRCTKIQTAAYQVGFLGRCHYGVKRGESLVADEQNAADKLCCLGIFMAEGGKTPSILESHPVNGLPAGTIMAQFTATMTHVADSWSPIAQCVFSNYVLDTTKKYKIVGMSANSATGYAHRLRFYTGADKANAPGVMGGDTEQISQVLFGDFGTFEGLTGVGIQTVAEAADATTTGTLWLVEV